MLFRNLVDVLYPRITHCGPRRTRRASARRRGAAFPCQIETLEARRLLTLAAAVHYPLVEGQAPSDLAAGDLNNDGLADLVATAGSGAQILLGSGDGAFQPPRAIPVAAGLTSVALADLNGDGRLDVVAASVESNGSANAGFVNILLNDGPDAGGNVTFQPLRQFSTGTNTSPGALAVGDLNGDGRLDVATAQTGGSQVSVLLGNGDGNLQSARQLAVGWNPGSVVLGHFNGDGRLDLVTADRGSAGVSLLLNNGNDAGGNATFQAARNTSIYGEVDSAAVGDFNADGRLDLAVTSSISYFGYYGGYYGATGYVNVLLGNGDGTFADAKTTWANNRRIGDVAAADFNGDGRLDVITPDAFQAFTVDPTVLLGRGDGTFDAPYHFDAGLGPIAVIAADLNGDAAADVGVANTFSGSVSVLLNDNDWPLLGAPLVTIGDAWITEGDTGTRNAVFTVMLSAAFHQSISIQYSTADGTGTAGSDYESRSGTLTFNPGGALSQTISVPVIGDRVAEAYSESFHVNISAAGNNARIQDDQGTGWISDDEPYTWVSSAQVVEGHTGTTSMVFTVSTSSSSEPLTIHWSTSDGTATAGSDYQASSGTLTFQSGGALTRTVSVPVYGDRLGESDEFFSLSLSNGSAGQGTILDDEPRLSISDASVTEPFGGGTSVAVFTVSLSQSHHEPVSVNFSTAEGDTEFPGGYWGYWGYYAPAPAATAGSDFESQAGTLTFAPGETSRQISVVVRDDRLAEWHEYFSVDLTEASANASIGDGHGLGSIADNEPVISIDNASVVEGHAGTTDAVFTVRLAQPYDQPVSVNFSTAEGDTQFPGGYWGYYGYYPPLPAATSGTDFQGQAGTLTFAPGETSREIRVAVYGDRRAEATEYFSVDLTSPAGNARFSYAHGVGSITDDEPYVEIGSAQVVEGNTGTVNALFTVTLATASTAPVTVDWSTVDDYYYGATAGTDYQPSSGTVTFNPGGPLTQTIAVPVIGDRIFEYSESFYVSLGNGSWWAAGTILDDEPLISISDTTVAEGDAGTTGAVFTVSLTQVYDQAVTVNYSTAENYFDPRATAGSDFELSSGLVTIPAGQISGTFSIPIYGDTTIEEDEYFQVSLSGPSPNAMISLNHAFGIIVDDDEPSTKFYVVDASSDKTFEYDAGGAAIENYRLRSGNNDPRGAASDASGERVWVIDNDDYVYVYDADGNALGSWKAKGLSSPEGIASDGTDIWIVDRGRDRVYRFAGAASRTSGQISATSSFALNSGNRDAKGIETDGTHLWVVNNNSTDKVFKYTLGGSLLGSWTLTGVTNPTGITLDPANPSDVWIVDASADKVFQYTAAASRTSGSQSAAATFALATGNANPQGIADPPPPGAVAVLSGPEAAPESGTDRVTTTTGSTRLAARHAEWGATPEPAAQMATRGAGADQPPLILYERPGAAAVSEPRGSASGDPVRRATTELDDDQRETGEPIFLSLFASADAVFGDPIGLGGILDDDSP